MEKQIEQILRGGYDYLNRTALNQLLELFNSKKHIEEQNVVLPQADVIKSVCKSCTTLIAENIKDEKSIVCCNDL